MNGPPSWAPRSQVREGDLRVSDAERAEVAALLSESFSAGRLDNVELDQRLNAATNAKTRAELRELLTDLPLPSSTVLPAGRTRRPRLAALIAFALCIAAFISFTAPFAAHEFPALVVLLVVLWIVTHRHRHRTGLGAPPGSGVEGEHS
jgi:hypothetical protein